MQIVNVGTFQQKSKKKMKFYPSGVIRWEIGCEVLVVKYLKKGASCGSKTEKGQLVRANWKKKGINVANHQFLVSGAPLPKHPLSHTYLNPPLPIYRPTTCTYMQHTHTPTHMHRSEFCTWLFSHLHTHYMHTPHIFYTLTYTRTHPTPSHIIAHMNKHCVSYKIYESMSFDPASIQP